MGRFEATTAGDAGRVTVRLSGECDLAVREQLTSVLLAAVGSSAVVVVDVSALEFLDSSGVHGLVTAHHAALAAGGRLYVVNAVGGVARVLDLTGLGDLLRQPADDQGSEQR